MMKKRNAGTPENSEVGKRSPRRSKKQSKILYYGILAVLLGVLIFSVIKIVTYFQHKADAEQAQNDIRTDFITPIETEKVEENEDVELDPESITVNFDELCAKYPDVVGYIYGANTNIQYPIVQSSDDDYYLNRDMNGNENNNGSIFMEYLNAPDFSDHNTLIYGHNMKTGLMFANLTLYKSQSYYDLHPYFYIYTPTQDYRLDIFAGFVCEHDDEVYALSLTREQLEAMPGKSTFRSTIGVPTGNVVTLSTCSYEFDNARYVVVGELVPLSNDAGAESTDAAA